jgi:hypothetical protein
MCSPHVLASATVILLALAGCATSGATGGCSSAGRVPAWSRVRLASVSDSSLVAARVGVVRVRVVDAESGKALAGAEVTRVDPGDAPIERARADTTGWATLGPVVPAASGRLRVRASAYEVPEPAVLRVRAGFRDTVEVGLRRAALCI